MPPIGKALIAEGIGTFALSFIGVLAISAVGVVGAPASNATALGTVTHVVVARAR